MSKSDSGWEKYTFPTGNFLAPVATVEVKEPFIFDLAFAVSSHKAQGRTIHRVVVDLTDHPFPICCMKYAAIFVAMSRVGFGSHLHLLEPSSVQSL